MSTTIDTPSTHAQSLPTGLGYLLLGVGLGVGLIASRQAIYGVEGGMSSVATWLPLGYAFAAGMVATVNPCGVLLLPSMVAFYLGQSGASNSRGSRAGQALELGAMATVGFVAIFAVVGLAVGAGGQALGSAFPAGGMAVGIGLLLLGAYLAVSGRALGILAASQSMGYVRLDESRRSMFLFGVAYAVASLACTLPVFLVVVGSALAARGILAAVLQFVGYALGMGLVLTLVIFGAIFFEGFVRRSLRQLAPHVHRLSASFLVGAGMFLVSYWLTAK